MKATLMVLVALVPLAIGCSSGINTASATDTKPDLRLTVVGLFDNRCVSCHNPSYPAGGLSLTEPDLERALVNVCSYANDELLLVSPGAPEQSYLIRTLRGDEDIRSERMPPRGTSLTSGEIELVERWIISLAAHDGTAAERTGRR